MAEKARGGFQAIAEGAIADLVVILQKVDEGKR